MKTIRVAVKADFRGFKQFTNDSETYDNPELPYLLKFIHIDDEYKCRGNWFNTYVVHWSARELKDYHQIIERVKTRIIEIK